VKLLGGDTYDCVTKENDRQHFKTGGIGMENNKNRKAAEPNTKPRVSPTSSRLRSPKRGAFPTPKAEIESARPYIPDSDQTGDQRPAEPDSPANADAGGNRQQNLNGPKPK